MAEFGEKNLDVICQHCCNGEIIPLRIRIAEDGELHSYTIKGYKNVSVDGAFTTPDNVYVTSNTVVFECIIEVFGHQKAIRLYYNKRNSEWRVVA